jgi:hypothetical protein
MILIWVLNSFLETFADNCSIEVSCGASITTDNCIQVIGSQVSVYGCKAGYECDYSSLSNLTCYMQNVTCAAVVNYINPCGSDLVNASAGMPCCNNADCASGSCSSGNNCQGVSNLNGCQITANCNAGLYCSKGTCTYLKSVGSACSSDDECSIGSGCNNNQCAYIFSLNNKQPASDPKFCKSNFVHNGECDTIEIYLNGKDTQLSYPYRCSTGSTCYYRLNSTGDVYNTSACSLNPSGSGIGYCSLYSNYTDAVFAINSELQYSGSSCSGAPSHTTNINDLFTCGSVSYYASYKYLRYFGQLQFPNLYDSGVLNNCSMSIGLFDPNYIFSPTMSSSTRVILYSLLLIIEF